MRMRIPVEEVKMSGSQRSGWAGDWVAPVGVKQEVKEAPGPVEAEGSWAPETVSSAG